MKYVRKALLAAAFATAAFAGGAMLDGNLTLGEAIAAAGTGLIAGAATYRVPNVDQTPPTPGQP